jgi:hypothetical protein
MLVNKYLNTVTNNMCILFWGELILSYKFILEDVVLNPARK